MVRVRFSITKLAISIISALTLFTMSVHAHGGDDHGHGGGSELLPDHPAGPIQLAGATIKNLGIHSVTVLPREFPVKVSMFGVVAPLPEKYAKVSTRFSGRIKSIQAKVGQSVKKDDLLLVVEPVQVGSSEVGIHAPISGTITAQAYEALGQPVSPDTTLLEIIDTSEVLVRGELFESPQFSRIAVGQRAEATSALSGNEIFKGSVDRINPSLQPGSLTFEIFAKFPNPHKKLVINTRAELAVVVSELHNRLVLPRTALLGELGSYFVFVRADATFERRRVTIGAVSSSDIEIVEGIRSGDEVVTSGHYQLQFAKSDLPTNPDAHEDLHKEVEDRAVEKETAHRHEAGHSHDDGHSHEAGHSHGDHQHPHDHQH